MHVAITILVVLLPFLFLLRFARLGHLGTGDLFRDVGVSLVRIVIAYIIAVVLAWICAVLFYHGRRAAVALPLFDVIQSIPTFAALPLAILAWGKSNVTVVAFLVLTIIWPIFFSIISSLKLIKHEWEEAVTIARLPRLAYVRTFILPVTIPGLITGSIIGLGEGWEALIATEIIVGIKRGLGPFFQLYSTNPTITILGILGVLVLIFCINKLIWLPLLERSHIMMEE